MGHTGRNIYIPSNSQEAIKALDSVQINSKLVGDCHQSMVKLAEHYRIQLVWVPRHMGLMEMKQLINQPDQAPHVHL
jgi:hypothetical protein